MKRILLIIGLVLAIAIPFTAFAATSDSTTAKAIRGFCGMGNSENCNTGSCDMGGLGGPGMCGGCSSRCSETTN